MVINIFGTKGQSIDLPSSKYSRQGYTVKKLFSQNIFITLILIGVFGYRHFQSEDAVNKLRGRSIKNLSLTSLKNEKSMELESLLTENKTLYIWATWCPPCRLQNQIINFYEKIGFLDSNKIIKISVDQDIPPLRKYLEGKSLENHFHDPANQFFARDIIKGTPSILKVNKEGHVLGLKMGINFIF